MHKVLIRIYSLSNQPLRSVIVGISGAQLDELRAKIPDQSQWSGTHPNVSKAIIDGITKEETERLASHLGLLPKTDLKFEPFGAFVPSVDETDPSFEMNGKKFWVQSKEGRWP